jgi:hypothetical protein
MRNMRSCQNPVIFFSSGIGDGVLALPALRALCFGFEGKANLVLKKGPDKFLFDKLSARRILFLDMWQAGDGAGIEFETETASLLLRGCDLFLSFVDWKSSSLSRLESESVARTPHGSLVDVNMCEPSDKEKHQFDSVFAVSARIFPELNIEKFAYPIEFSADVREAGEEILRTLEGRILIGFHPESSLVTKSCPDELVQEAIQCLLELDDDVVVFVFGANSKYSQFGNISTRVLVFNYLPLKLAAYLVSRMSFFAGVDSCFLHVADICRVPGVGLFGPTSWKDFGFRFAPHVHIQSDMEKMTSLEIGQAVRSLWCREGLRVLKIR